MTNLTSYKVSKEAVERSRHVVDHAIKRSFKRAGVNRDNVVVVWVEPQGDHWIEIKLMNNWTPDFPPEKAIRGIALRVAERLRKR